MTNYITQEQVVQLQQSIESHLNALIPMRSFSGEEYEIFQYCYTQLDHLGFLLEDPNGRRSPNTNYKLNNILATRGVSEKYVLLNAHMDVFYTYPYETPVGYDDKAGIAAILGIVSVFKDMPIKILFTTQEETMGPGGVLIVKPSFYDNVDCCIVLDRMGNSDIIDEYLGKKICDKKFAWNLLGVGNDLGVSYKIRAGTYSDAYIIAENVKNVVNMSIGYYNPHTQHDYLKIEETVNTAKVVVEFILRFNLESPDLRPGIRD